MKLQPGETILIHGGAGGVASFATQLAKHIGARAISGASSSSRYAEMFGHNSPSLYLYKVLRTRNSFTGAG